jgi:hypothetical protein
MDLTYLIVITGVLLFPLMLITMEVGRRLGLRRLAKDPEGARAGAGVVESAVFALLGLLIAFTFSGAGSRYEARRDLLVQQANAIGTAWLRLDLLPKEVQPGLRQDLRLYLDKFIELPRRVGDRQAIEQIMAHLGELQAEIWSLAETAAQKDNRPQVATLVLPALNEMFDIGATRYAATKFHISTLIIGLLLLLSLLAALLAGYGMASKRHNWLHMVVFAALVGLTLYVILDLELPRRGLIQLGQYDQILIELRQSMQ